MIIRSKGLFIDINEGVKFQVTPYKGENYEAIIYFDRSGLQETYVKIKDKQKAEKVFNFLVDAYLEDKSENCKTFDLNDFLEGNEYDY
jgi:hypothetical protein